MDSRPPLNFYGDKEKKGRGGITNVLVVTWLFAIGVLQKCNSLLLKCGNEGIVFYGWSVAVRYSVDSDWDRCVSVRAA